MASIQQPIAATRPATELIKHSDGGITLPDRRAHVCLSATWEIDALVRLLANLPIDDEGDYDLARRGLLGRILQVNDVAMSALASADERTADLERTVYLKPIGEPEAH